MSESISLGILLGTEAEVSPVPGGGGADDGTTGYWWWRDPSGAIALDILRGALKKG